MQVLVLALPRPVHPLAQLPDLGRWFRSSWAWAGCRGWAAVKWGLGGWDSVCLARRSRRPGARAAFVVAVLLWRLGCGV